MKKGICAIIMAFAGFMVAAILGGMEFEEISLAAGFAGSAFWLAVMVVAGVVGRIFE